jgi:hypothetical protein
MHDWTLFQLIKVGRNCIEGIQSGHAFTTHSKVVQRVYKTNWNFYSKFYLHTVVGRQGRHFHVI